MSKRTDCCVFTRGEFFIRDAATMCGGGLGSLLCEGVGPFKKIGNIDTAIVEIEGSIIGKENEFNPADPASRTEILGVTLSLNVRCASVDNLRRALYGEEHEALSGHYVEDFCFSGDLSSDSFFPFKYKGVNLDALTVYARKVSGAEAMALVSGVDYLASSSGVKIINDNIETGDRDIIRLSYDYDEKDFYTISFGQKQQKYKEIYFKGTNYGEENPALFDATFYRVLFAPQSQFDLITRDDFFQVSLTGTVEKLDGEWFKLIKQE